MQESNSSVPDISQFSIDLDGIWGPILLSQYCVGFAVLHNAALRVQPSTEPPVEQIFPLELAWVLTPFPKAVPLDLTILLCQSSHKVFYQLGWNLGYCSVGKVLGSQEGWNLVYCFDLV